MLYFLIYGKRFLFWLTKNIFKIVSFLTKLFNYTIGFRIYKFFLANKTLSNLNIPWKSRLINLGGKRSTLQIFLFIMVAFIMIPQSKLFGQTNLNIPGQNTLLYKLVGPGEEDLYLEDVQAETLSPGSATSSAWKVGSIVPQIINTPNQTPTTEQEFGGLIINGTALNKPIILTGIDFNQQTNTNDRSDTIIHIVQSGETISDLSKKYNISIETILWANNLTAKSKLKLNAELKILPVSGLVHKIVRGDNISKLAKLYNADKELIIKFNKLNEAGTDIKIGEELIIPNGKKPIPVVVKPAVPPKSSVNNATNQLKSPLSSSKEESTKTGYIWPTAVKRISQYYSWRHTGLDIAGPVGTPIYATKSGKIIKSQCGWNGGYGCYIIIDHGNGVQSLYGHNSQLFVSLGEQVEQGQNIALMGSTGRSTGPHLHFEIRVNGKRANGLQYVR